MGGCHWTPGLFLRWTQISGIDCRMVAQWQHSLQVMQVFMIIQELRWYRSTVKVWPVTLFEGNSQQPQPTVVSYPQDAMAYESQHNAVQAVAWLTDSRYLASVVHDVQIFDSFSGKPIYTYTPCTIPSDVRITLACIIKATVISSHIPICLH